jgi:hypothetical protein
LRFLQTGKGYFTIAFGNPGKAALSCVASLIAAIPSELHKIAFAHVKRRLKIEKIQTSVAKLKFPFQPFAKGPQANNKFLHILPGFLLTNLSEMRAHPEQESPY